MHSAKITASSLDAALDVARRTPAVDPSTNPCRGRPSAARRATRFTVGARRTSTSTPRGHVEVTPDPEVPRSINLYELAQDLKARGLELPLLIRFSDIVARSHQAHQRGVRQGDRGVRVPGHLPRRVPGQGEPAAPPGRRDRRATAAPWNFGLEAGTKPELLIALAAMQDVGGLIICNGYKDSKYIETALVAQKFDKTVIVVLERLEELDVVFEPPRSSASGRCSACAPSSATTGVGRWADSAGDRAKFGLTTPRWWRWSIA